MITDKQVEYILDLKEIKDFYKRQQEEYVKNLI